MQRCATQKLSIHIDTGYESLYRNVSNCIRYIYGVKRQSHHSYVGKMAIPLMKKYINLIISDIIMVFTKITQNDAFHHPRKFNKEIPLFSY